MNTPTPEQIAVKIAEIANDSSGSVTMHYSIGGRLLYFELDVDVEDELIQNATHENEAVYNVHKEVSIEVLQIYNDDLDDADDVTEEFKDEVETIVNKLLK